MSIELIDNKLKVRKDTINNDHSTFFKNGSLSRIRWSCRVLDLSIILLTVVRSLLGSGFVIQRVGELYDVSLLQWTNFTCFYGDDEKSLDRFSRNFTMNTEKERR